MIQQHRIIYEQDIRQALFETLPHYMIPDQITLIDTMPQNNHGKIDIDALKNTVPMVEKSNDSLTTMESRIAQIWSDILKHDINDKDCNFFDCGGHSLLLVMLRDRLNDLAGNSLTLFNLFEITTIRAQAAYITKTIQPSPTHHSQSISEDGEDIAIIGMVGKFPQSPDIESFWNHLIQARELLSRFSNDELQQNGVPTQLWQDENYIPVRGTLADSNQFDASLFGLTRQELEWMDPQQRVFLEQTWLSLENAGINPFCSPKIIGLFASQSISTYLIHHLLPKLDVRDTMKAYQALMLNDKDHLTLRTAYHLGLTGPAISIQTACSSSLVAVHLACRSILGGDCDIALAGGVSIATPNHSGYLYQKQSIFSADGHCKAFDNQASGTVGSDGIGIVVLTKLSQALRDKHTIYAIIKSSACNNDGYEKAGYTAPGVKGQIAVIQKALSRAKVSPDQVRFIEAHGTGTRLGDLIELNALASAYQTNKHRSPHYVGSVKSNVGHLDAAAGVTGLIKMALSLQNKLFPSSLHIQQANSEFPWEQHALKVNQDNYIFPCQDNPYYAAVSAMGIGGTNAHIILQEPPKRLSLEISDIPELIILSANSYQALQKMHENLLNHCIKNPDISLLDIGRTLQEGRQNLNFRCYFVVNSIASLMNTTVPTLAHHYP